MDRRKFLVSTSIAVTAGCISGAEEDGPAAVEESQSDGGVALTVEEARLANEMETGSGDRILPDEGYRFAFLKVESRNTADEIVDLARQQELRLIIGDEQIEPVHEPSTLDEPFGSTVEGYTNPVTGDRYEGTEDARPDVSTSGWLVFHVPSDTEEARLSWARQHEQEEPLYWELEFKPNELADIRVVEVNTPSTVERHETVSLEIVLENQGGSRGRFRRTVLVEPTGDERHVEVGVGAGETLTHTEEFDHPIDYYDAVKQASFTIAGRSTQVSYEIPVREIGESYATPGGLSVEVAEFWPTEYVKREGGFDTIEHEPDSGEQLALVELIVENRDDDTRTPPSHYNFEVIDESGSARETSVEYPGLSSSNRFLDPIDVEAYDDDHLPAGESEIGWMLIKFAENIDLQQSRLRWAQSSTRSDSEEPTDIAAEWEL